MNSRDPEFQTVLLVDDDPAVLELFVEVLRAWGYFAIAARDAREALMYASLYSGRIDLLLTDMIMPGGHGQKLASQVRYWHPGIKVLFVSGYASLIASCWDAPSEGPLLAKPVQLDTLRETLSELLSASPSPSLSA